MYQHLLPQPLALLVASRGLPWQRARRWPPPAPPLSTRRAAARRQTLRLNTDTLPTLRSGNESPTPKSCALQHGVHCGAQWLVHFEMTPIGTPSRGPHDPSAHGHHRRRHYASPERASTTRRGRVPCTAASSGAHWVSGSTLNDQTDAPRVV